MSQEILFTSSERGLRAGSTGFCTVRSTVGMPQNLASLLEQLTGYTHAFDAYDGSLFDKHPTNFAHYISRVGGQRFHILCRISNAPLDHTNRSNKLAHLIVFEDGEIDLSQTQGPAAAISWMIPPPGKKQSPGTSRYWITDWPSDREPCVLPDSNRLVLPPVNDDPGPCKVWKQVVGDAGWAAVLAESIQDRKRQSVPIVFSSGQKDKCLDLVQEALSLLPPAERWGVTFSTFQSGSLPTKVECRWQFLLDSTDLARKARRNKLRTPLIDLTSLKGMQPPESELAPFTNSGKRPWDRVRVSVSRPSIPKRPPAILTKPATGLVDAADDYDEDLDSETSYPLRAPGAPPRPRRSQNASASQTVRRQPSRRWMAVVGAVIVLSAIVVLALPHLQTKRNAEIAALVQGTDPRNDKTSAQSHPDELPEGNPKHKSAESNSEVSDSPDQLEHSSPDALETDPPASGADLTAVQSPKATIDTVKRGTSDGSTTANEPEVAPKPFDDLRKSLSKIPEQMEAARRNTKRPYVILSEKIDVVSPFVCEIDLVQTEAVTKSGFTIKLDRPKTTAEKSEWTVKGKGAGPGRERPIGQFSLEDALFRFRFDKNADETMKKVFLETAIRIYHTKNKKESVVCSLGNPEKQPQLGLTDTTDTSVELLDKQRVGKKSKDKFYLDCTIDGLAKGYTQDKQFQLSIGGENSSRIFTRKAQIGSATATYLDIELSLINTEGVIAIHCKQWITYAKVDLKGQYVVAKETTREEFSKAIFKKNVETAKTRQAEAVKKLTEVRKALDKSKNASASDKAEKLQKQAAVDRHMALESEAQKAVDFAKEWIKWSVDVSKERDELLKSVTIHYQLRRNSSLPDDEQAILVSTEDVE